MNGNANRNLGKILKKGATVGVKPFRNFKMDTLMIGDKFSSNPITGLGHYAQSNPHF